MDRLQFMGSTLFIPIFLVSVGVLLEPKVMVDPKTLLVALVFTVAVLGGKALAAVVAGRVFHFSWPEIGVMSGLSGSQAAATLATTLVGAKLGLFDTTTINAVLVVILASLVITPLMVSMFGKRVPTAAEDEGDAREDRAGSGLGRVEPGRCPPGGTPRDQRRRHRRRGQLRQHGGATAGAEGAAQAHRRRRRSGWPRTVSSPGRCFASRRRSPRVCSRPCWAKTRRCWSREWRMRETARARQRSVRGARAHAGAGPDRARRRRDFDRVAHRRAPRRAGSPGAPGRRARGAAGVRVSPERPCIGIVAAGARSGEARCSPASRTSIGSRPPIRSTGSSTTSRRRTSRSSGGWRPRATRWRASRRSPTAGSSSPSPPHETTFHKREEASPARWWWGEASSRTRREGRIFPRRGEKPAGTETMGEAYKELQRSVLRSFTWEKRVSPNVMKSFRRIHCSTRVIEIGLRRLDF